jgi:hypothetical protein
MGTPLTRRDALLGIATGAAAAATASLADNSWAQESGEPLKGNINHSVSRWCYGQVFAGRTLPSLQTDRHQIGGITEAFGVGQRSRSHGLTCAMTSARNRALPVRLQSAKRTTTNWSPNWRKSFRWRPKRACPI